MLHTNAIGVVKLPLFPQSVWVQYKAASEVATIRAVSYEMFCKLWRTLLAHITVMKPMTDLCSVCQQNSTALMRAANLAEEDKSEVSHNDHCYIVNLHSY